MSYYYGSNEPEIKNPFKREGLLYLINGGVILIIGIVSLLLLRSQVLNSEVSAGLANILACFTLLGFGLGFIGNGLLKIFRFYVGRGIPGSLASNVARSESHVRENEVVYRSKDLEQMLTGHKNPTFVDPNTITERFIHSILPSFIFMPYSIRNYIHIIGKKTIYSFIALFIYLIALISGSVGLTQLTETSFASWMGIALLLSMVVIWFNKLSVKKMSKINVDSMNLKSFIIFAIGAVLVPVIGELYLRQGFTIPEAPFNPVFQLFITFSLIVVTMGLKIYLANKRDFSDNPLTDVSEYNDHWQENIHPRDLFRCFGLEMVNMRYKEMPNRVYREFDPVLRMESQGGSDKGSFEGETILETQPMYEEINHSEFFKQLRIGTAIFGHILLLLSAITLFLTNFTLGDGFTVFTLVHRMYVPVILGIFGFILINTAHMYWAEMNFKSYLVHLRGEGTYTESKLSVGMSITDSARSENSIVRSSLTPYLYVSEIISSTQATAGSRNLGGARYVLEMRKADGVANTLIQGIRNFLENKSLIAETVSGNDMDAVKNLFTINSAAPGIQGNKVQIQTDKQEKIEQK